MDNIARWNLKILYFHQVYNKLASPDAFMPENFTRGKTMNKIASLLLVGFLLVSCGPSEKQIQEAIEHTRSAELSLTPSITPTQTETPTHTVTSTPTRTTEPTLTATITPQPTPTPDIRIITGDPYGFLLEKEDLPIEAKYYQPGADFTGINTNEEIQMNMNGMGNQLVERTGRLTGVFSAFLRGASNANYPNMISIVIEQYQTIEGANVALLEYNDTVIFPESNFKILEESVGLGDHYIVYKNEFPGGGGVNLSSKFTYRNILVSITLSGKENQVYYDTILILGRQIIQKLENSPLELP